MPDVKFLCAGIDIGVVGGLVEIITDFAVILRGQDKMHHGARHTVHKVILGGFAFLNDGFQFFGDGLVGGQVQRSRRASGSSEECIVQLGGHTKNMIGRAAVQNAVNAIQPDILLLQLLDDFFVGVDGYSNGLRLYRVALAGSTGRAIRLGSGIHKAFRLDGAGNRIAGQVHVLYGSRNQGPLDIFDDSAIQLGKVILAFRLQQDVKRGNTGHNSLLLF